MFEVWNKNKELRVAKIKKGQLMLLSECVVLDSKISRFIKEKEASDLLSNLGLKRPFSRNPLLSDIKF